MYEFWYDYVKPKYGEKAKLCYMDKKKAKKAKGKKMCVIKRKIKFENYKNILKATELKNNINHLKKKLK